MTRHPWSKPFKVLSVGLLIMSLLTGCWDRQEIEERAIVLGMGIDAEPAEADQKESEVSEIKGIFPAPKKGMITLTAQIAVAGRIPLGPGQGGGMGGGGGEKTVWVVSVKGHTIDDAINNLQQRVATPIFLGHLRVIAVSDKLAKRGIENLNDYFRRNPEIRRMNWMFVCKGRAADYMNAAPQLERVPTVYFLSVMDQAVKMGRFPNDFLGLFWSASSAKGQEGFLPCISLKNKETIEIEGLAFFKNDKAVGVTSPLDIPMYMGIKGLNPAGGQSFVQVPGTNRQVMFGSRTRKSTTRVKFVNGRPQIQVKIHIEGNLLEKTDDHYFLSPQKIKDIQTELEKESKKAYEQLISKTQAKSSDIFGFGEYVRAKAPFYWNREIKTKENWQKTYRTLSVQVQVDVKIRRIGMKGI